MDHDEFIAQVQHRARLGSRGDAEEFFERVHQRERVDQPDAVFHARAVVEDLDEATTGGLMRKVREQLPSEFDPLFEAGSTGRMSTGG